MNRIHDISCHFGAYTVRWSPSPTGKRPQRFSTSAVQHIPDRFPFIAGDTLGERELLFHGERSSETCLKADSLSFHFIPGLTCGESEPLSLGEKGTSNSAKRRHWACRPERKRAAPKPTPEATMGLKEGSRTTRMQRGL